MLNIHKIDPGMSTTPENNRENIKQKTAVPVSNIPKKTRKRYKGKFSVHVWYNFLTSLLNVKHKSSGSTSNYQLPTSDIILEQVKRRIPKKSHKRIGFTSRGNFSTNFTQFHLNYTNSKVTNEIIYHYYCYLNKGFLFLTIILGHHRIHVVTVKQLCGMKKELLRHSSL